VAEQRYPKARITMLSNSRTQKIFIDDKAKAKGFANIEVRSFCPRQSIVDPETDQIRLVRVCTQVITGDVNFYKFEDRKCVAFSSLSLPRWMALC
jgi:pyruvate/2-oxoacid:ferredoxin oxidoreductase beta subunit